MSSAPSTANTSLNNVTWGYLLDRLHRVGVTVEQTESDVLDRGPGFFLYRRRGDEELWYPLPRDWDAEEFEGRRVGPWTADTIFRRLQLNPKVVGLAIVL